MATGHRHNKIFGDNFREKCENAHKFMRAITKGEKQVELKGIKYDLPTNPRSEPISENSSKAESES